VSDTSAPLRVDSFRLWISSTQIRLTRASTAMPQTASITSVMLARGRMGMPRKRANSTASIRGVAAGGTVT